MINKSIVSATLLAFGLVGAGAAAAHDPKEDQKEPQHDESAPGHSHEMSEIHGGRVTMTPKHHFEVVFAAEEARIYFYDHVQKPLQSGDDVEVSLTLKRRAGEDVELSTAYVAPDEEKGRTHGYYAAAYDFGSVEKGSMKALVRVAGLVDDAIEFRTNVSVSEPASYVCPMKCGPAAADPMACPSCGMKMVREDRQKAGDHSRHEHSGHEGNH